MQHGLNCLEAQEDCPVVVSVSQIPRLAALSSQNMLFGIGLDITVCLLASILFWRGERERQHRGEWSI